MSSIAKSNISLSKKDLTKSRILPVASRNVVFYHKAIAGQFTIDLLALTMPSEMPSQVQATVAEIDGALLYNNKKNLRLVSSTKGELIQGLDYLITSSYTINLIGPYETVGTEPDEIFIGTINAAPVSDLVVASAKSVFKTYELAIGQTILNLGREYQVGLNPNDNIGILKVFVNGVLAIRGVDYYEIDSGNGYGSTIGFYAAPPTLPYQVVVDFGVMAITDQNAIGDIQSLAGSVKKLADDLAVVAGTDANDYFAANPSEIERRTFGDTILSLNSKYDTTQNLSAYTKTKFQTKSLAGNTTAAGVMSSLTFNNVQAGKVYRVYMNGTTSSNTNDDPSVTVLNTDGTALTRFSHDQALTGTLVDYISNITRPFIAPVSGSITFSKNNATGTIFSGFEVTLEELPNHQVTTQWT